MDSTARFGTFRARLSRKVSTDSVFEIHAVLLASDAHALQAVTVTAERPMPERSPNVLDPGVGAIERPALGVSASTMPEQRGDLQALAGTVPGVTLSPLGVSVLGIGGQSSTTMNGLSFQGASVPRDIRFTTRVSSSTYDPSRGWFGGAETSVQIEPGSMLRYMRASATFDNRALQSGDRLSSRLGQRYSSAVASLGGDGYTASDRLAYSFGLEVSKKTAMVVTPSNLDSAVLNRVGLATDSVSRTIQALTALGVPIAVGQSSRGGTATSTASLLARFNTPEFESRSNARAKHSFGLILYAFYQERDGIGASPLALSTRQSAQGFDVASAQLMYSTLQSRGVVQSVRSALSQSRESSNPLLQYPSGEVQVLSVLNDSTRPNVLLGFGAADVQSSSLRLTWETQSKTAFYVTNNSRHLFEFTADARFDKQVRNDASNSAGRFSYSDLEGLSKNQPSLFSRTLAVSPQRGEVWNGFLAASDSWRPSTRIRMMFGVRMEANYFSERPASNSAVTAAFGVRNDFTPNRISVSPRFGFQWRYVDVPERSVFVATDLGVLPFFATGVLRGGFGRFTGFMSPGLMAAPSAATGLAGSNTEVACYGRAAPTPDWRAYSSSLTALPASCLPTSGTSSFEDAAPSVRLIDQNFSVADSWRVNIGWAARTALLSWSVDATFAWNRHQASELDLNFSNTPKFLTSDDGRPIFVSTTGIVAATGAISPTESRMVNAFGRVLQTRSDLSGVAKQLVVTVNPNMRSLTGTVFSSVSYTLGSSKLLQRGFDNTTFGSPSNLESQRTNIDTRHSILTQLGVSSRNASLTLFGLFASGRPFTPLVQTDVNGDGLANDRAFVFDPQKLTDVELAVGMRSLLSRAPSYARRCLTSQIGNAAGANSCTGPWTAVLNARLTLKHLAWHSAQVSLSLFNLPGALDQLIHGTRLAGWGNAAAPDPILFRTYRFDAEQKRFVYRVNPRFGDSNGAPTLSLSPFRVNLDVRLELGPSESRQLVRRLLGASRSGRRGIRLDVPTLVPRLRRSGPQPYREMLELADSLLLTEDQLNLIVKADEQLRTQTDSVWTELAEWLAALPDRFDEATAVARQESATDRVWEIARQHLQMVLRPLLTPQQIALLPAPASVLFASNKPLTGMRFFDYRDP